jgi:DNA polymerase III subunit delta
LIIQTLQELERDVKANDIRTVYLVLGPEQYQSRLAIDALKNKALNSESIVFDYSEFKAGEASMDEVIESANTFPMLSKRRVVVLNGVENLNETEQGKLLDSCSNLSKRGLLILVADELDRRKRFYKAFREQYCVAEFPKLREFELEQWAQAFVRSRGYSLSPAALKKIVGLAGSDLQSLASEMEKLLLYSGNERNISDAVIDDLVRSSREHGIFELIGALGRRDRAGSLRSLANLLSMGENILVIVSMMARHCRQVLIAKECLQQGISPREIGSAAQIPPFLLDQFLRQARAADSIAIQTMHIGLADIDRRLKSSSADGRVLLEKLICALL